jgi:hypothetical protein
MYRGVVTRLAISLIVLVSIALAACGTSSSAAPTVALKAGNYTPLGGVQKNDQPTPSELADLQAAESGTLGQPALVEFYADY